MRNTQTRIVDADAIHRSTQYLADANEMTVEEMEQFLQKVSNAAANNLHKERAMTKPAFREWTSGCYGLKNAACVATADALVWRINQDSDIELLMARRGPGRFGENMWMFSIGGFVDPGESVPQAVMREVEEEGSGMRVILAPTPFSVTGSIKYRHYWEPDYHTAISMGELSQDIPIVTMTYSALWLHGEPTPSKEVPKYKWVRLKDIRKVREEYFSTHAVVLQDFIKWVETIGAATLGLSAS